MFLKRHLKLKLLIFCVLWGIRGCELVRETLDINHSAPDELSETSIGRDLTISPSFDRIPKSECDGTESDSFLACCPVKPLASPEPQTAGP
jgi:hypothetical protein